MPATLEQIARFAARHAEPGVIVLPNAWDPGSAALMAAAGFEAIATTSAAVAHAQGAPDGALGRDEMLEHAARIARTVPVPVTADLEDGYGPRAEDVALTVAAAVEAGLAGCNIEDSGVGGDPALIDAERACDRIRAARGVIPHGRPFVLNARTVPRRWRPRNPLRRGGAAGGRLRQEDGGRGRAPARADARVRPRLPGRARHRRACRLPVRRGGPRRGAGAGDHRDHPDGLRPRGRAGSQARQRRGPAAVAHDVPHGPGLGRDAGDRRERTYLSWFFDRAVYRPDAFTEADLDMYVRSYAAPGGLGLGYYRTFYQDAADNRAFARRKLPMPALGVGGAGSQGDGPFRCLQAAAEDARCMVVERCGHYVPEEQPEILAREPLDFFARSARQGADPAHG